MPNSAEHKTKASANRAFLNATLASASVDTMWAAVVAFYTALHLVERLASCENIHHAGRGAHGKRLHYLEHHSKHHVIYHDYLELKSASEHARYGTINQFARAYPGTTTQDILIDKHLVAIEKYVTDFFAPPHVPPTP